MARKAPSRRKQPRAPGDAGKAKRRRRRIPMPIWRRRAPLPPSDVRYCDVVMKGGITSGVVYPLAAVELSKVFKFKNIGGTSAGAIAAAFTACAEYGRDSKDGGFEALADLPKWFGESVRDDGKSNLFALFQPAPSTAPFFNIFASGLRGRHHPVARFFRILGAAGASLPMHMMAGAAPGLAVLILTLIYGAGVMFWTGLAAALLLLTVGIPLAVLRGAAIAFFKRLPENFYGLCTGYADPPKQGQAKLGQPLTNWLTETIDRLAGRDPGDAVPLTFGDLWMGDGPDAPGVNLQMMTTNLTQGRPLRVPFEDPGQKGIGQYYFDPDEMRRLFPAHIVDWMVDHANWTPATELYKPLVPLPLAKDLPVTFGARLSLSYPLLLSAIPLYTVDWTRDLPASETRPERCWFSDGGISSNFPIHFFDQPLPRWPTFAINLRPPHIDLPDQEVWMPRSNRQRGIAIWDRFDAEGPTLRGFLNAIKDVGQNWMDNEQARVPGFRDRIVHITLKPKEGGVNLDMPGAAVGDLAERGRRAGRLLADRFVSGPAWDVAATWETHRWVRFRSTMQVVEELLRDLADSYQEHRPDERSYAELVKRKRGDPPTDRPWYNAAQRKHALTTMNALIDIVESWDTPSKTFGHAAEDDPGPPEPYPTLRIVPRV